MRVCSTGWYAQPLMLLVLMLLVLMLLVLMLLVLTRLLLVLLVLVLLVLVLLVPGWSLIRGHFFVPSQLVTKPINCNSFCHQHVA